MPTSGSFDEEKMGHYSHCWERSATITEDAEDTEDTEPLIFSCVLRVLCRCRSPCQAISEVLWQNGMFKSSDYKDRLFHFWIQDGYENCPIARPPHEESSPRPVG